MVDSLLWDNTLQTVFVMCNGLLMDYFPKTAQPEVCYSKLIKNSH